MSESIPHSVETEVHVRYAETDAMGVVHHAAYLVYFEEGRSHFMRTMGSNYADIEASGFRLPVTEAHLRYSYGVAYGDMVNIRTWLEESRSRQLTFAYELISVKTGKPLVRGYTKHVWTDTRGKVTRAPRIWTELLARLP
ncbi:MAG: thioesterase family protein [Gammaproteobacteria bacterium]|nr:acyl-CoA thioesterase [Pseudomonadales bacterium]MCP5345719.1 acyl-CoA thioesterase [Pseudomonadales bacterium]